MKITANQVTGGRILALPIPCIMLIYGSRGWQYLAFGLFLFLGVLDLYDGILARRQGPTKFGAMLDPLADKMFIVCVLVPMAALEVAPVWLPAAVVGREYLVTALRSLTALRDQSIRTSVLAKLKTSIQMAGLGFIFVNATLPSNFRGASFSVLAATTVIAFAAVAVARRGLPSVFVWLPSLLIVLACGASFVLPVPDTTLVIALVILVFTWGSGVDYLVGSARIILRDGIKGADGARMVWVASTVVVAALVMVDRGLASLVVVALCAEFLVGGVDNLRALSGQPVSAGVFSLRSVVSIGLAAVVFGAAANDTPVAMWVAGSALALVALVSATWDTYRVWPLLASKEAHSAYSSEPPPRAISEVPD